MEQMLGIQRRLAEAWWERFEDAPHLELGIRYSTMNTKPLALPRTLLSQVSQQRDQW